jgi:hypothetical protein
MNSTKLTNVLGALCHTASVPSSQITDFSENSFAQDQQLFQLDVFGAKHSFFFLAPLFWSGSVKYGFVKVSTRIRTADQQM